MKYLKIFIHSILWTYRQLKHKDISLNYLLVEISDFIKFDKNEKFIFLDIGSHAGTWALAFNKLYKNTNIYCFEAFNYYCMVLKLKMTILCRFYIKVINVAISDIDDLNVNLNYENKHTGKSLFGMNFISKNISNDHIYESVKSKKIDTFVKNEKFKIGFIKLDIEGSELLALLGAKETIEKDRPVIFFEFFNEFTKRYNYSAKDINNFFLNLNYCFFKVVDHIHLEKISEITIDTQAKDFLAIPNERESNT